MTTIDELKGEFGRNFEIDQEFRLKFLARRTIGNEKILNLQMKTKFKRAHKKYLIFNNYTQIHYLSLYQSLIT